MKIISLNLNGIRSAQKKGLNDFILNENADYICLQELKADINICKEIEFKNYFFNYFCAIKSGYSGVGILSKNPPSAIIKGFNVKEFDDEGRILLAKFNTLWIISAYFPSGSANSQRQESKERFMRSFNIWIKEFSLKCRKNNEEFLICGDLNISLENIDIKNWKNNMKNSGFLPHERKWLKNLISENDLYDIYRYHNPQTEEYTWWSNRGSAREKNIGWRIDYQLGSEFFKDRYINKEIIRVANLSDHAPLIINYKDN